MQSLPRGLSFGTKIEYDIVVPHDTSVVPSVVVDGVLVKRSENAYTVDLSTTVDRDIKGAARVPWPGRTLGRSWRTVWPGRAAN